MFIGFIYFLVVMILSSFTCLIVETKTEKDEKKEKEKTIKKINKQKEVNRYWFDINVK
jgi:hypothetical protein